MKKLCVSLWWNTRDGCKSLELYVNGATGSGDQARDDALLVLTTGEWTGSKESMLQLHLEEDLLKFHKMKPLLLFDLPLFSFQIFQQF